MARRGTCEVVAVTLSVLLVGACSESGGGTQAPAPEPISVQEYSTTLAGAVGPLESALKGLVKAEAYQGLERRVGAVQTAAAQAVSELGQITPPAELAGAGGHPELLTALQGFSGELGEVASQVGDRALCTGSAVRTGLGDAEETSALRDALAAVSAKLPERPLALTLPRAGQQGDSRPRNGKLLRAGKLDGRSNFTIDNGGSNDAVVTLSEGKRKPVVSVYVRKDKKYTVAGVPDGSYTVFFTGGADWDGTVRAFGRDCAFQRFDPKLKFRTTQTSTGVFWTDRTITLHPVVGGTASTTDVDPDDFPDS
jgi:hypothetical protein